ncbi:MAG: universal stress protein [Deltaproteobacteria bacterium]|nr:universal stress protein [Deltaproteobacteria bacterium]
MANKIRTILCPTDFSPAAQAAVDEAGDLAKSFSAELVLVHVVAPLPAGPSYGSLNVPEFLMELHKEADKRLTELAKKLTGAGIKSRHRVLDGVPYEKIVETAKKEKADMVVISTHGRTGVRRMVFGSVAEKVLKLAPCPVLVVPAPKPA